MAREPVSYEIDMESRAQTNVVRLWTTCPRADEVTDYDKERIMLYSLLLEAETEGVAIGDMGSVFFDDLPKHRLLEVVRSHLSRAHWMVSKGFFWLGW